MTRRPDRAQAVLDRAQSRGRLPSIVAAITTAGEVSWQSAAGERGGVDLQYRIGSITKTMTAALVLQARDDGLLELDEPIGRLIPECGYPEVSIAELLSHHAGIPAEPRGPWWERSPGTGIAALLAANTGGERPLAGGVAFHYSNLGYALLGEAVARARQAGWAEVLAERILNPLAMGRTTVAPDAGRHAQGFSVDHFAGTLCPEPHHETGAMAPAGQLWSTLADLARWLEVLAGARPDVLAPATATEMSAAEGAYGLGARIIATADGRRLVGHTGSMPGFLAAAFVDPATRRGAVLLANATTGIAPDKVAADLLGAQIAEVPPQPTPWVPAEEVPEQAAGLLGLWFWGNSAYEMRWHNGALELRALAVARESDRFAVAGEVFRGVGGYHLGETLRPLRNAEGRVAEFECATFRFTRSPYPDGP